MRPALFLDRDGVINVDHGYVYRPAEIEFIDGVFELVAAANSAGYLVIIVTNQAGIGRGFYTEEDFHALTNWMLGQFNLRGADIDAVYYCPFHPEHGIGKYRHESVNRKPGPGMLLQAAKEHGIDLKKSIMVGDKISDMMAGQSAFVGTLLYIGDEPIKLGLPISELKEILPFLTIK